MSKFIQYSTNKRLFDKIAPIHKQHYADGWENKTTTIDALVSSILSGFAFAPQYEDGNRKGSKFICSNVIAADFDGTRTLDDIRNDPYVNAYASFIYTTPSHTAEQPRARAVFICDEPITKAAHYADALLGLAEKLGSDLTANDGARCFFGSSNAEVWRYPNVLPADQLNLLIERGRLRRKVKLHRAPIDSSHAFASDMTIKLTDGSWVPLNELKEKTSIHCPYHDDRHPSAFTVKSRRSGSIGVYCKACHALYWPDEADEYDFYGFERLVEERAQNPKKNPRLDSGSVFEQFFPPEASCFVTEDRYLKQFGYKPGTTLVKSPKGTGKTEVLKQIVSDVLAGRNLNHLALKDRPKTILLIGHRRSLLREAAAKLGLCFYLEIEETMFRNPQTLAVCLDSLPIFTESYVYNTQGPLKFRESPPFDLVILDESEQLFAHSIGDTLGKKHGAIDRAYDSLQFQIANAKSVIALDADISLLTAQVLKAFRPKDWDYDTRIFYNKPVAPKIERTLQLFSREVDLRDDLLAALDRGERCFVACNSKRTAKVLSEIIRKRFGSKFKMKVITSDNSGSAEEIDFVQDIAAGLLKIQVLICSPSLGTGVDITFPDPNPNPDQRSEGGLCKVDCVYGFFSANVNTHTDMDQQLCRVRNPGAVKVWISPAPFQYATNFEVIRDDLARARFVPRAVVGYSEEDGQTKYLSEHPQLMIYSHVVAAQRSSKNRLIEAFCELRRRHGWKIEEVAGSKKKDLDRREAEKALWHEKVSSLLKAPVLDDEEYFDLQVEVESKTTVSVRDRYTYERNTLERVLGIPLTDDIIRLNYDGRLVDRVAVLKTLVDQWPVYSGEVDRQLVDWQLPLARLSKMTNERLLCLIAKIAGLSDETGLNPAAVIASEDLSDFADLCQKNRTMMEELLGRELRSDIQSNPVRQLGVFLSFCGLRLEKRGRRRVAGRQRREYGLDARVFGQMAGFASNYTAVSDLKSVWERIRDSKAEWSPVEAVPLAS